MIDSAMLIGKSWSALRREALAFAVDPPPDAFDLAVGWSRHPAWEVRFFAVVLLGNLAARDDAPSRALAHLYDACGQDEAWQVNEALAMAFDDYCAAIGYERALPELRRWLAAPSPNLRRAVSEGLRPWTSAKRAYFARNPRIAVELLGALKDDPSRYVQESVGNALRDIGRKEPELVLAALRAWLADDPASPPRRTIARYALEQAVKRNPALRALYE